MQSEINVLKLTTKSVILAICFSSSVFGQVDRNVDIFAEELSMLNRSITLAASHGSMTPELKNQLRRRAVLMEQLIDMAPSKALELSLPTALSAQLRLLDATVQIEELGEWNGVLEKLIADDFKHRVSRNFWHLNTGSQSLDVTFVNKPPARSGPITLGGLKFGRRLVANSVAVMAESAGSGSQFYCATTGALNVAVLMVTTPSNPNFPPSFTPASVRQAYFGSGPSSIESVNGVYREMSYGLTSITGDVFGPIALTQDYENLSGDLLTASLAAFNLSNSSQYDHFVVMYPFHSQWILGVTGQSCQVSPFFHPSASVTWIPVDPSNTPTPAVNVYAHELGHGIGLSHSNSLDYGAVPLGPIDMTSNPGWQPSNVGPNEEYGDEHSIMSTGWGHFPAEAKALILNWLSPANWLDVRSAGTFLVRPFEGYSNPLVRPFEAATNLLALRVLRDPASAAWLWIEYRQPVGVDAQIESLWNMAKTDFEGALIHSEDPNLDTPGHTYLLNFTPPSTEGFPNAALAAGNSWSDPYSLLKLKVNSANSDGLSVTVDYDQPCAQLQFSESSFPSGGGTATVAVMAPESCAWTASSVANWISFNGVVSGQGNGSVNFTVAGNADQEQRSGYITIQRQSTRIIQEGTGITVLDVIPSAGNGNSGQFTFEVTDTLGYADIQTINVRFLGPPVTPCQFLIYGSSGKLTLADDNGFLVEDFANQSSSIPLAFPGQSISNHYCKISSLANSISASGNVLKVSLGIDFVAGGFSHSLRIEASAKGSEMTTGMIPLGMWTIPQCGFHGCQDFR